jgi:serine/threonine protein kinase
VVDPNRFFSAQSPSDPLAGTPYRTLGPLGRGAMGEVVEAEHIALAKRVVVKILHRWLSHRPDLFDRMRLEGQALAHLSHPNIVTVTDLQITTLVRFRRGRGRRMDPVWISYTPRRSHFEL